MRTMSTEKLMKTLPIIQNQLDALLDFEVNLLERCHSGLRRIIEKKIVIVSTIAKTNDMNSLKQNCRYNFLVLLNMSVERMTK